MTPDQHTLSEHYLETGDGHTLYVQEWGNPTVKTPIFFLHGGPGSYTTDNHKANFNPYTQRVIFHDQRGCGKSLPLDSLEHNTTGHLVGDIELIAKKLRVNSFILVGGSWGSCLALAYGLAHPKRVKAMVLDGIFTGSQKEIDWLDKGVFWAFFPDAWNAYLAATPKSHQHDPSAYHFKRILGKDPAASKESCLAYEKLELSILQLDDRLRSIPALEDYDPSGIRIEVSYLQNRCFMPDRHILDNARKLTMPLYLIQGRYDMVCPPSTAFELDRLAPNSKLFLTISGHRSEHEDWNIRRVLLEQLCA